MKIGRIIIYSLTICFVAFLAIFMIGLHLASTRPLPPPGQEYLNGHVSAELYFEDQGAWGAYITLVISGLNESAKETIYIRAEDSKPTLDSIVGKDIYISVIVISYAKIKIFKYMKFYLEKPYCDKTASNMHTILLTINPLTNETNR